MAYHTQHSVEKMPYSRWSKQWARVSIVPWVPYLTAKGQSCHIPKEAVCGSIHPASFPTLITETLIPADCGYQACRWVQLRGSIGRGLKGMKKGKARISLTFSLCLRGHLSRGYISCMALAPTRHAHQGCWVTQLPTPVTPILSLTSQSRGLVASHCCWLLDSFAALCLASQRFHHLRNQFLLLNILYLIYLHWILISWLNSAMS